MLLTMYAGYSIGYKQAHENGYVCGVNDATSKYLDVIEGWGGGAEVYEVEFTKNRTDDAREELKELLINSTIRCEK